MNRLVIGGELRVTGITRSTEEEEHLARAMLIIVTLVFYITPLKNWKNMTKSQP